METRKALLLLLVAGFGVALLSSAIFLLCDSLTIYRIMDISMDVYVDPTPGFNTDNDSIHFGKLPPDMQSQRKITVTGDDTRTLVTFNSYGDIAKWVYVSDNDFILEPHTNRTVSVFVSVPKDAEMPSFHNGTLRIVFYRK
jgi:hypothetical protein